MFCAIFPQKNHLGTWKYNTAQQEKGSDCPLTGGKSSSERATKRTKQKDAAK